MEREKRNYTIEVTFLFYLFIYISIDCRDIKIRMVVVFETAQRWQDFYLQNDSFSNQGRSGSFSCLKIILKKIESSFKMNFEDRRFLNWFKKFFSKFRRMSINSFSSFQFSITPDKKIFHFTFQPLCKPWINTFASSTSDNSWSKNSRKSTAGASSRNTPHPRAAVSWKHNSSSH